MLFHFQNGFYIEKSHETLWLYIISYGIYIWSEWSDLNSHTYKVERIFVKKCNCWLTETEQTKLKSLDKERPDQSKVSIVMIVMKLFVGIPMWCAAATSSVVLHLMPRALCHLGVLFVLTLVICLLHAF